MIRIINIAFVLALLFISCSPANPRDKVSSSQNKKEPLVEKSLLENVKLAITPKYQDWVLFENGTYIIFDNADTISDIEKEAIKLVEQFGPVYAGSPAGDFGVHHLNNTDGWVVSGHCEGMYTYVNPNELEKKSPTDVDVGLFGRSKREMDGQKPVVVYINRHDN